MWPCSLGALLVREGERATEKEWRRARGEARGGGGHVSLLLPCQKNCASALARWPGASAPSSSLHKKCLKGEAASDSGAEGHLRSTLRDLCCGRKQTAPQVMGGGGGGGDACCCCISSRLLRLRSSLSAARRLRAFSLSSRTRSLSFFRLLSSRCVRVGGASSRGRPLLLDLARVCVEGGLAIALALPLAPAWGGKARKKELMRQLFYSLDITVY